MQPPDRLEGLASCCYGEIDIGGGGGRYSEGRWENGSTAGGIDWGAGRRGRVRVVMGQEELGWWLHWYSVSFYEFVVYEDS